MAVLVGGTRAFLSMAVHNLDNKCNRAVETRLSPLRSQDLHTSRHTISRCDHARVRLRGYDVAR
jgi:hypothetical protein